MLYFFVFKCLAQHCTQNWVVTRHQYGISALVPQMSLHGETSGGIVKVLVVFLLLHVREPKTVLDSGFHAVDSGIQVLNARLCQWNLDSRFQLLVRFRIP